MESFEILAEVAVGLAGFGSLAIVLARDEGWSASDYFRVTSLLLGSLGALFLALLPVGLGTSALGETAIWRASSGLMVLFGGTFWVVTARMRDRHLDPALRFGPLLTAVVIGSGAIMLAVQGLNASGLVFPPGPTCYFFGVVWFLGYACLMFVRVFFFRPTREEAA